MTMRARLVGTGSYLPAKLVTNQELAERVETSDAWIVQRTGICQRHVAAEGELTSDLAHAAATRALEAAGLVGADLDLIIVGTTTPDETFPATATKLQARLGMHGGAAFDLQAVCSGFVYGLGVADAMIRGGQARTVLIVGAETFTRLLDWNDRTTCVLFGDGAGAVVLRGEPLISADQPGVLATRLRSDGREYDRLYVDGGPSSTGTVGHVRMDGKEVFRHAVTRLAEVAGEVLAQAGIAPDAVDWLVPHQANQRIIDATARKLGLDPARVVTTVDRHANTSAASIPLALDTAVRDGRIKPGHTVVMEAMGGGFTWGAAVVRL
jgi:3-oxoacyl-[acyl-carrier-protein] synthase-3